MRTLFTATDENPFNLQTIAIRLIQYFFVGVAITACSLFIFSLTYRSCDPCAKISQIALWPIALIAYVTYPMCADDGTACFILGVALSAPINGVLAYISVRLIRRLRRVKQLEPDGEA